MPVPPDLPFWTYPVLFVTGLVAGLVDAVAGGGGLVTLPTVLSLGVPAPLALGTNKLGSVCGSLSSTWSYARRGAVDLRECLPGFLLSALGGLAGACTVRLIDPGVLRQVIPWLLAAIVLFFVFRPRLGETDRHHRMPPKLFYVVFGLALGYYDGFFGPGAGAFWTIAFVMLLGHNFVKAAAHTKAMNLASNAAALATFAWHGAVLVGPGLALGAGTLLGARFGSHLAMTRGARFVRPIFLLMASLVALRLIYSSLAGGS
ncbi:MAG: TSUP family transporter [Opitutaceae bacterium]|nr:TSUP family transporter [Opitutaceae bacterium]